MKENLFSIDKTVYNALNVKSVRAYSTDTEDRVRIEFIDGDRVDCRCYCTYLPRFEK